MSSVIAFSHTILRISRCVPANARVWGLEKCVLIPHFHTRSTLAAAAARQGLPGARFGMYEGPTR